MNEGTGLRFDDVLQALDRARIEVETERRKTFAHFGIGPDCAWPAARLFHDHSRLGPQWRPELTVAEVTQLTADVRYRRYDGTPLVALPSFGSLDTPLEHALRSRRSTSEFDAKPVALRDISTVLGLSCGVVTIRDSIPARTYPSGGALYPIETYVFTWGTPGLLDSLYHYVPGSHALERLREHVDRESLAAALPPALMENPPPLVVVLTGVFARSQAKYLERGYRFILLEAGHIAQNIVLVATALGLASITVGGFWDDPLNAILELDGTREAALSAPCLLATRLSVSRIPLM